MKSCVLRKVFVKSQRLITHVGSKVCICVELRAEELCAGCDYHLSFKITSGSRCIPCMYTESWSCDNPHLRCWCMQIIGKGRSFNSKNFEQVSVFAGKILRTDERN